MSDMDAMQKDILTEIGSIGAGNATTSLSVLLNSKLNMKIPNVSFMAFDEFVESIGGAENIIAAVMSNITGGMEGFVLFAMSQKDAHTLCNRLLNEEVSSDASFDEMDLSAVKEIGNILISSYLAALETLVNMAARPERPLLAVDMAGAILSYPAIINSREHDDVLCIESQFEGMDLNLEGRLMLIVDNDSYAVIREKLGIA